MAEITLTLFLYGGAGGRGELRAANAHELLAMLEDPEFSDLKVRLEPTAATESAVEPEDDPEPVLSESEALAALEREIGAVPVAQGSTGDAKAAFLSKFGKQEEK